MLHRSAIFQTLQNNLSKPHPLGFSPKARFNLSGFEQTDQARPAKVGVSAGGAECCHKYWRLQRC
jgi:hypothetical protein